MKLSQRILLSVSLLLVFSLVGISIYIRIYGQQIATKTLTEIFHQDVKIKNLRYHFPFGLKASYLSIGDFFECQKIKVQVNMLALLRNQPRLASVFCDNPIIRIEKQKALMDYLNKSKEDANQAGAVKALDVPLGKGFSFPTDIDVIVIRQGKVFYKNHSGELLQFEQMDARVEHFSLSFDDVRTDYHFSGVFLKEGSFFSGSKIESSGWMNMFKKDMDGIVNVMDSTGKIELTARMASKDNQMNVSGEIAVGEFLLQFKNQSQAPALSPSLQDMIFGAISNLGMEGVAKFSFSTPMDDFQIKNINFEGNIKTQ